MNGTGAILKTNNGGNSWVIQTTPNILFYSVYFTAQDTGYVVGNNGTILKTTNGGIVGLSEVIVKENFTIYPNPSANNLKITFNELYSNTYFLEIINSFGESVVKSDNIINNQVVKTENLKEGVYFIKISSNTDYGKILKFVKVK